MSLHESPFWNSPTVSPAVLRLAAQDDLTLVVGAGASVESGFPLWGELVRRLVEEALRAYSKDDEKAFQRVTDTICRQGPLAAASYAKTLLAARFDSVLQASLYRDVLAPSVPGGISLAAARLHLSYGPESELITLNYDEQLFGALQQLADDPGTVKSINGFGRKPVGQAVVRHLHGRAYGANQTDSIVLTEEDYFAQTPVKAARDKYMRQRLDGGPTLFVGTSLADSNLLGYLHSQKKIEPNKHVAIFTSTSNPTPSEARLYENASSMKWRKVGVTALQNRMFAQTAQFLHEIRLARENQEYIPYKARLISWEQQMAGWVHNEEPDAFERNQNLTHGQLQALLLALKEHLDSLAVPRPSAGHLAIELWSRRPTARAIRMLASTVCRFVEPSAMPVVEIAPNSKDPVVITFATGAKTIVDVSADPTPWGAVMALPVTLDGHQEFWRLPVGVLVLRSTLPLSESVLSRLSLEAPEVDDLLVAC